MSQATEAKSIELQDVGPIEKLSIPVPQDGGVVVLKGRNGVGKSHALASVSRVLGDEKSRPASRDGKRKGVVDAFGVRINVASRITQAGELDVESLEGKFDLTTLVDPGVADPVAADSRRIKSLLRLSGWDGSVKAFEDLVGGPESYDALAIEHTDDVVLLAARVKRALEKVARDLEQQSEKLAAESQALLDEAGDPEKFDYLERSQEKLDAQLAEAIKLEATLSERIQQATKSDERRQRAVDQLEKLPESNLADVEVKLNVAREDEAKLREMIEKLEEKLMEAVGKSERLEIERDAERRVAEQREQFEKIIAETDDAEQPDPTELAQAQTEVKLARKAVEDGIDARRRDRLRERATGMKRNARELGKHAADIRDQAQATEDVLSEAVAKLGVSLKVVDGRLCVESDRGDEPVAELSHGERWKLAIDIGVDRVGEGGVLSISQEGWEGLDPMARQAIVDHAKKRRVVILTAECDGGELRAETH